MSLYEFGPFQLDATRLLLLDGGAPVALGPKVVETLLALIEHPGDVLTKQALLDRVWPEGYVDEANLAQNIYVLRKTLRARWPVEAIETVPRCGYRFTEAVRRLDHVPSSEPAFAASAPPARRRWWPAAAAAAAVALIASLAFTVLVPHRAAADGTVLSANGARLYEIGRYYWNLRTSDGLEKSVHYFTQVVDSDPKDPRGYAALASANAMLGDYAYGPAPAKVYFARARAYARKALAIDARCGEAYAVLGMISTETPSPTNLAKGVAQLRRAIALDPSDAPAHEWYGIALMSEGNFSGGYAELKESAQLDPLSVATTIWLGEAAYLNHRYAAAIGYAQEAIDFSPLGHEAFSTLGLAYEARGDMGRAIAAFHAMARSCAHCRYEAAALLAEAYERSNRPNAARREMALATAHAKDVQPQDLAAALFALGKRRVAFGWLRRVTPRGYLRAQVANDPRFDRLRNDPELAQVAQKPA